MKNIERALLALKEKRTPKTGLKVSVRAERLHDSARAYLLAEGSS